MAKKRILDLPLNAAPSSLEGAALDDLVSGSTTATYQAIVAACIQALGNFDLADPTQLQHAVTRKYFEDNLNGKQELAEVQVTEATYTLDNFSKKFVLPLRCTVSTTLSLGSNLPKEFTLLIITPEDQIVEIDGYPEYINTPQNGDVLLFREVNGSYKLLKHYGS